MKLLSLIFILISSTYALDWNLERRVRDYHHRENRITQEASPSNQEIREYGASTYALQDGLFQFAISPLDGLENYRLGRYRLNESTYQYALAQITYIVSQLPPKLQNLGEITIRPVSFGFENGQTHRGQYRPARNRISLQYQLFFRGNEELLKRALIHELAHAYDLKIGDVSHRWGYRYLAGWHQKSITIGDGDIFVWRGRRQFYELRSPDAYEYNNPPDSFAVNMEHFLLDSEFQCRRPLMYQYLSIELGHNPYPQMSCEDFISKLPVHSGNAVYFENYNPAKLYQVHYLVAGEGRAMASRFGHSMIRLVMCASHREQVGPECLNDIESHIVLSYRANVTDTFTNNLKGIFGGYESQAFIFPMNEMIKEYTQDGFRELISYPMNLSENEMQRFHDKLMEEVWAYRGKYRFITQNCATETLDYFKGFMHNEDFLHDLSLTPFGVRDVFVRHGLIDLNSFEAIPREEKITQGLYFPSQGDAFERYFNRLKRFYGEDRLRRFIKNSSASSRAQALADLIATELSQENLASYMQIELYFERKVNREMITDLIKLLEEDEDYELTQELRQRQEFMMDQLPNYLQGYGIPSNTEFEEIENYTARSAGNAQGFQSETIEDFSRRHLADHLVELEKVQLNIQNARAALIQALIQARE